MRATRAMIFGDSIRKTVWIVRCVSAVVTGGDQSIFPARRKAVRFRSGAPATPRADLTRSKTERRSRRYSVS
jgi:hypothetical protein